jgi:hypothetical protein
MCDRWAKDRPDVMDGVAAHFALDCGGVSVVLKFGEKAVDRRAATDGHDARVQ